MSEKTAEWMTYRELADALGITYRAAEARARRHVRAGTWPHRIDNTGARAARVLVPLAELERMRQELTDPPIALPVGGTVGDTQGGTYAPTLNALLTDLKAAHEVIVSLHERVGRAEGEAGALRDALAHERTSRAAAEAERLATAAERDAAQAAAQAAQAERDTLAADLAGWTAGGPLARAWRAFTRRGTQ